jgi:selenocysteine lyase/cysteine desulfurase
VAAYHPFNPLPENPKAIRRCWHSALRIWRPKAGVRFSPHFYNTDEEVDAAIIAVEAILNERV